MNDVQEHDRLQLRADEILRESHERIYRRTDRMFAVLMVLQWFAAVAAALCLAPTTWDGAQGRLHPHIFLAVSLGGVLCALPVLLAWLRPGQAVTRYAIVIAQVLFSSLLIHITGGRIETHFHVFGSLAIMAAYRDWKVFIPATIIIAGDHLVRGLYWPQTTFGVFTASPWRALEHAGWVLFEDVFLILSIRQSTRDMRARAQQSALLEGNHAKLQKYSDELVLSMEKGKAIIEGALDVIVQMNRSGQIISWNGQAEHVFGWSENQAIGRLVSELMVPKQYREAHLEGLREYWESGRSLVLNKRLELEGLHRDGRTFPIEIAITQIGIGQEAQFCAFIRDITDRKSNEEKLRLAKEQAEAASRTKSEFLANMSHEIRTPLNGILGFTELLIRNADQGNEAERRDYIRTIRSSGKHLLELINDILDLSKIEAGQLQLEMTECSPHQLIAEVVSVLRARAQEKGISLEYRWEGAIPEGIQSDPYRLRQLLMNLVGNAVKFTTDGGVTIVTRLVAAGNHHQFVIEVHDTGIGISREHLEAIFRPFVQADNSVTRQFGGTGLGLAISKNICESLGGTLSVRSEPGRGSTFTVALPIGDLANIRLCEQPPAQRAGDIIDSREGSVNLAGVRVLLADDGETNRKLINLFLSRQGAEVVAVENGELAVAATMSSEFDVILMDMQMPVMDGYAATRKLRSEGYVKPIIALTAHAMAGDRQKCDEAGCSGYVSKPVNVDELIRVVLTAAKSHQRGSGGALRSHQEPERPAEEAAVIRSTLPMDDPEIRDLVAEFAATVPERIDAIEQALQAADFDTIAGLAHALKGAGGTAGFACLTDVSARLEHSAREHKPGEIDETLDELRCLHQRITL